METYNISGGNKIYRVNTKTFILVDEKGSVMIFSHEEAKSFATQILNDLDKIKYEKRFE